MSGQLAERLALAALPMGHGRGPGCQPTSLRQPPDRCPVRGSADRIDPSRLMCCYHWYPLPKIAPGPCMGHLAIRPGTIQPGAPGGSPDSDRRLSGCTNTMTKPSPGHAGNGRDDTLDLIENSLQMLAQRRAKYLGDDSGRDQPAGQSCRRRPAGPHTARGRRPHQWPELARHRTGTGDHPHRSPDQVRRSVHKRADVAARWLRRRLPFELADRRPLDSGQPRRDAIEPRFCSSCASTASVASYGGRVEVGHVVRDAVPLGVREDV
jgi:hypothetical protein